MQALLLLAFGAFVVSSVAGQVTCPGKPANVLNFKLWPNSCVNATQGTVCTAVCNDRYTSLPAPTSTCQANGQWSAPGPICQPTCVGAPDVVLAGVTWDPSCGSSTLRGTWCSGSCTGGLTGSPQVYCSGPQLISAAAGTFTSGWTTTSGSCGTPPASPVCPSRPATVTNSPGFPTSCAGATQDTVCTAPCNGNSIYWYNATGYPQRKCQADGTWSAAYPLTCVALKVQNLNPKCMTAGTFCTKDSDCCAGSNCTLSGPVSPVTGVQQRRCGSGVGIASLGFAEPAAGPGAGDLVSGDAGILADPSAPLVTPDSRTVAPAAVVEEAGVANPTAAAEATTPATLEPVVAAGYAPVDGQVTGRRLRSFGGV